MDRKKEIETIRQFNRYYTNLLGVLDKNFLGSSFSLAEIRILYFIQITPESSLKKMTENSIFITRASARDRSVTGLALFLCLKNGSIRQALKRGAYDKRI